jgi:hypothetical protein
MIRKWLTKAARTQGHSILSFHNPFRLVPVGSVAELGDKLIRNEILTPNEMRGILGFKPSDQENADSLRNPNMPMEMVPMAGGGANEYDDTMDDGTNVSDSAATEPEPNMASEATTEATPDDATVQNVLSTMNDEQLNVLNYLLDMAEQGQTNPTNEE